MPRTRVPAVPRSVASVFASYPPKIRSRLMQLRKLIFETAAASEGVGEITETLKWGEPAYCVSAALTYHRGKSKPTRR